MKRSEQIKLSIQSRNIKMKELAERINPELFE